MRHYRIYYLSLDGKIDGKPAEIEASSDDDVVMRALVAERNAHGAEVWCGATLVRRVDHVTLPPAYAASANRGTQTEIQQ